jgi:dipeptidyl aminopeptidase/acylaminoacyl peptidase
MPISYLLSVLNKYHVAFKIRGIMCIRFVVSLLLLLLCYPLHANPIATEDFARLPAFSNPQISPDGNFLASTLLHNGKFLLVVQDFSNNASKQKPVLIPFEGVHIHRYYWANNERLIVTVRITHKHNLGMYNIARLMTVSRDGRDIKEIEVGYYNKYGYYFPNPHVVDWLDNDPDHILAVVERAIDNKTALIDLRTNQNHYLLHKVNVNTGEKTLIDHNRQGFYRWVVDADGNPRIGVKVHDGPRGYISSYYRVTPDSDWKRLEKLKVLDNDRLTPLFFDEQDSNILIVTSDNLQDEDYTENKMDLHRYDLTRGQIIGAYEDPDFTPIKNALLKRFPNTRIEEISRTRAKDQFIIVIYSDVAAPSYFHYNKHKKTLAFLAAAYPYLENAKLSPMQELSYQARDQLKIPAYLTLPLVNQAKNLPLVVMPHGGPWARDDWGFDNYVQFLASRGYAVFQPQFRGSTGFGNELHELGFKQWGYAIQDDITDGVNWLVSQGIADPQRVCIVGASFGGYAAAMGLVRTPDLYQCAISINGVMNMNKHYHNLAYTHIVNREITNSKWGIKKASPYHLAAEIKQPLLIIAGKKDSVVNPDDHSIPLYKKLKKLKKPVHYLELSEGEHWRTHEKSEIEIFKAMEEFLQEHIGSK